MEMQRYKTTFYNASNEEVYSCDTMPTTIEKADKAAASLIVQRPSFLGGCTFVNKPIKKTAKMEVGCKKCGGLGVIHGYHHIQGGQCFACGGKGY